MENLKSKQTNRIFPTDTLSGRLVDTSILSQASGIKGAVSKNPVKNKIQQIWNRSGKKYVNAIELQADALISTPDKLTMRPMWFGSFANQFENRRLFITSSFDGGNTRDAHDLIPFGFSNPGHPLTMDYEGNVDVISGGPLNDQFDVFRYDPANPYSNINSFDIRKSPLYKTKHTSIIVDSGTLLDTGVYIPDYSVSSGPDKHNTKIFARKRKVIGAINNPWDANPNSTITPSNAETIISRTTTGYKLCIKLKNYKDYILTDDQIPKSFSEDQYENLMDSSNPRNKRFLN